MKITGVVAALGLLAACVEAPTAADIEAKAKAATVTALGQGVSADAISISGLTRGPTKAEWQAQTPAGVFDCDADERFSMPACNLTTS